MERNVIARLSYASSSSGIVYLTTNLVNGKLYLGSHAAGDPTYLGSGLLLQNAIKKYGKHNFIRETLYEGSCCRDVEEFLLHLFDCANNPLFYNLKNYAIGGAFIGAANGMFGKKHTAAQRYACGSGYRGKRRPDHAIAVTGSSNPNYKHGNRTKEAAIANKIRIAEQLAANAGKYCWWMSAAQSGANNSSAKQVTINNATYGCIKDAMTATGLSRYKIKQLTTSTD